MTNLEELKQTICRVIDDMAEKQNPKVHGSMLMSGKRAKELGIERLFYPSPIRFGWGVFTPEDIGENWYGYPSEEYVQNLCESQKWFREFCGQFDCVPFDPELYNNFWALDFEVDWFSLSQKKYVPRQSQPICAERPRDLTEEEKEKLARYRRIVVGSMEEWV